MIYTRFGTKVTIVTGNSVADEYTILYPNGQHKTVSISDLRADGGYDEINKAVRIKDKT